MRFCTNLCELMGGIMELFRDRCVGYVFVVDELPASVSAVRERRRYVGGYFVIHVSVRICGQYWQAQR